MLSDLQNGSAGSKLPGLPGLPGSQNKLSNLLNITGRKKWLWLCIGGIFLKWRNCNGIKN